MSIYRWISGLLWANGEVSFIKISLSVFDDAIFFYKKKLACNLSENTYVELLVQLWFKDKSKDIIYRWYVAWIATGKLTLFQISFVKIYMITSLQELSAFIYVTSPCNPQELELG